MKSQTISKETVEQLARENKPLLSVEHAQIGYVVNGKAQVAMGDASFEIFPGEKIMLLGPSGYVKSPDPKSVRSGCRGGRFDRVDLYSDRQPCPPDRC